MCLDGLNSAGLGGGLHEFSDKNLHIPMSTGAEGELSYSEVLTYMLAMCDTVTCAKKAVEELTVVDSASLRKILQGILGLSFMPIHYVITSKGGKGVALEWPLQRPGQPSFKDLEYGVFTNEPKVSIQMQTTNQYLKNVSVYKDPQGNLYDMWPGGSYVPFRSLTGGTSFNGDVRFTRLHMLRQTGGVHAYPVDNVVSPGYYGDQTAAARMAESILRSVVVPGAQNGVYVTQWEAMRDHVRSIFYFKTIYTPTWHSIKVKPTTTKKKTKSITHLPIQTVVPEKLSVDVSDMFL